MRDVEEIVRQARRLRSGIYYLNQLINSMDSAKTVARDCRDMARAEGLAQAKVMAVDKVQGMEDELNDLEHTHKEDTDA